MLLLVVEFAHRGKHARSGIGRAGGGFGIDDGDRTTGLCERVGDSQADDARTNDHDIDHHDIDGIASSGHEISLH